MRIDLTYEQYHQLWLIFYKNEDVQLFVGKHEGSTYKVGPYMLCESDGDHWLDLEPQDVGDILQLCIPMSVADKRTLRNGLNVMLNVHAVEKVDPNIG